MTGAALFLALQIVSPLAPPAPAAVDTTARNAAAAAATAAQQAALAAAVACKPGATVPPMEIVGGSAGSGDACRLDNAVQPRISRSATFSYGTDGRVLCNGSATCLWQVPLPVGAASYPLTYTPIGRAATCYVASSNNVGFTGMVCAQPNLSIALAGSSVISAGLTPGQLFITSVPSTQANQ